MAKSLVERVAGVVPISVSGTYERHAAVNRDAFAGGTGGRWGRSFPVIYLGRPSDSVVVEAYRHLVDAGGIPAARVRSRVLYTVRVSIGRVLDLRSQEVLDAVGLTAADLSSEVDDYSACQEVAAAAHQLELHGILAPAATGLGETLAVFTQRATVDELPVVVGETTWTQGLPADPRLPRLVPRHGAGRKID